MVWTPSFEEKKVQMKQTAQFFEIGWYYSTIWLWTLVCFFLKFSNFLIAKLTGDHGRHFKLDINNK